MATRAADASGDLEAGGGEHHQRGFSLACLINTAIHLLWSYSWLLRSFPLRVHAWLTPIRRRMRKIDHNSLMDRDFFCRVARENLLPSDFEFERMEQRLATECLDYYNARHPGNEYVLASGTLIRFCGTTWSGLWIHGNFVARPRKPGCFSFVYGPRTLFFFELHGPLGADGIVTCTPLDEPVNEAYNFLGFSLWSAKRRSGRADCVCKTCGTCHSGKYSVPKETSCGHSEVKALCRMCYLRSDVVHPSPGKFACGHQQDASFNYYMTG